MPSQVSPDETSCTTNIDVISDENNIKKEGNEKTHNNDIMINVLEGLKRQSEDTLGLLNEQTKLLAKQTQQQRETIDMINESLVSLGANTSSATNSEGELGQDVKVNTDTEDDTQNYKGVYGYLLWRLKNSAFLGLIAGKGLHVDDSDEVINALILVNALILTIPFGVFPDMEFWEQMREVMQKENCLSNDNWMTFNAAYLYFRRVYFCVIYSSLGCIVFSVLYYLFRPRKDEDFIHWWKGRNGREILFLTLAGTLVSVFAIFYLAAFMFQFYSVDPDMLCDNPNSDSIAISYMTIFVLSSYVILRHI